jgi:hypothetical protein
VVQSTAGLVGGTTRLGVAPGARIGKAVMAQDDDMRWLAPWLEALQHDLRRTEVLLERYPDSSRRRKS